jgi:TRAP transporter TAXI family solute receptor
MKTRYKPFRRNKSWKTVLKWFGPSLLLAAVGFMIAYQFVEPAPPKTITLAAGPADGAYYTYALAYRHALSRNGITINILETAGTVENLKLLKDGDADIAFVQSGVAPDTSTPNMLAIASLYLEPLWIFYRGNETIDRIPQLKGKRCAIGAEGSGSRALGLRMFKDNGLDSNNTTLLPIGGTAAATALENGEIDAALFVASPHTQIVPWLLQAEGVSLVSFSRADALQNRHRFLSRNILYEGVINPSTNLPSKDHTLLSPAATLVCQKLFHPALVDLFLDAATSIHGQGDWLELPGDFPSPRYVDFPLSDIATDFFESGRPFLRRVLPFWAATLFSRLKIMLLPLLTLAIPLFKLVPRLYQWRVRRRINRWYQALQKLEAHIPECEQRERLQEILEEISRIEEEVAKVKVPASYGDNLYQLRFHTSLARQKLDALK